MQENTKSETTGQKPIDLGLSERNSTGAISEALAEAYFYTKGYEVFRPTSIHSRVDFIAYKERKTLRVQVKTASWVWYDGYKVLQGAFGCSKSTLNSLKEADAFDVVVMVSKEEGNIWVIPLSEIDNTSVILEKDGKNYTNYRRKDYSEYKDALL